MEESGRRGLMCLHVEVRRILPFDLTKCTTSYVVLFEL